MSINKYLKAIFVPILHDSEFEDNADCEEYDVNDDENCTVEPVCPEPVERHGEEGKGETDCQSGREDQNHLVADQTHRSGAQGLGRTASGAGSALLSTCMVKGSPMPSRRLKSGPPKQAL